MDQQKFLTTLLKPYVVLNKSGLMFISRKYRLPLVTALIVIQVIMKNVVNTFFRFSKLFGESVSVIWNLKQLLLDLESIRTTGYDSSNTEHEQKLLELWSLLMPARELESRVSNSWKNIGFQGDDPKTDFRGMGILGLENLQYVFFFNSENFTQRSKRNI